MHSRFELLRAVPLVLALLSLSACAPDETAESGELATEAAASMDASQETVFEAVAPRHMTCAEIAATFGDEQHEEEASYLLVWAYGVRTGAKGMDFDEHEVTPDSLEEFATRLVTACKADPNKLFVDAILE